MKIIFICADGTWNTPSQTDRGKFAPSNVVKMSRIILSNEHQLVLYDTGVGTNNKLDKFTGGAFGHGLFENLKEDYKFIVENFNDGDQIVIFGFSRGAYTARSLAGLISKVGILRKKYICDIKTAYDFYKQRDIDKDLLKNYSESFCHSENNILFLGVWDTVGALGIPLNSLNWVTSERYKFHDTCLSKNVKNAYHAIAIDEKRRSFQPTLWKKREISEGQTVKQVWFAGVHSNIGGGYEKTGLSDITLEWMLANLRKVIPEIILDDNYIQEKIKPDCDSELRDSRGATYLISKLLPHIRTTDNPDILHQEIHKSVYKRIQSKQCNYIPTNVKLVDLS